VTGATRPRTPSAFDVHVVGAGLAGLSCAVRLAAAGLRVAVHEATDHGGGRCRSLFDPVLERVIDNGNHLLLSGNVATHRYLRDIGAADTMASPPSAVFPFLDVRSGERWVVRPNRGPVPWWIFVPSRRIPKTRPRDYLAALRLLRARPEATVAECFGALGPAYERFWRPLAVAVLNTEPEQAAARLLWPVVKLTFGKGAGASRPCVAKDGLSASLVDPAVAFLRARGAAISFNRRLRALGLEDNCVTELRFTDGAVPVGEREQVVLAVPPSAAKDLVPGLDAPVESSAIVNAHFRLPEAPAPLPFGSSLLGLVGGTAEWLFLRRDVASVTVSAATSLATEEAEPIAARVWPEVALALGLSRHAALLPPYRVIKERRATFAQTPESLPLRPPTRTAFANLFLAGDWTGTGLPATIEGAVVSGANAARAALKTLRGLGPP
jgi:squalene-associated FAD-dependent desaturase